MLSSCADALRSLEPHQRHTSRCRNLLLLGGGDRPLHAMYGRSGQRLDGNLRRSRSCGASTDRRWPACYVLRSFMTSAAKVGSPPVLSNASQSRRREPLRYLRSPRFSPSLPVETEFSAPAEDRATRCRNLVQAGADPSENQQQGNEKGASTFCADAAKCK